MSNLPPSDNPFVSPAEVDEVQLGGTHLQGTGYVYQSAAGLYRWVSIMLLGAAVLDGLMAVFGLLNATVLGSLLYSDSELPEAVMALFGIQAFIGLMYIAWYIVSAVAFCKWVYRANKNARAMGAEGMEFTPGWTVGWFFAPIMNLFKPFQAVREIYLASTPDTTGDWRDQTSPVLLGTWWGFWILMNIVGNIDGRVAMQADTELTFVISGWISLISGLIGVVAAILAWQVVRLIQRRQEVKYAAVGYAIASVSLA